MEKNILLINYNNIKDYYNDKCKNLGKGYLINFNGIIIIDFQGNEEYILTDFLKRKRKIKSGAIYFPQRICLIVEAPKIIIRQSVFFPENSFFHVKGDLVCEGDLIMLGGFKMDGNLVIHGKLKSEEYLLRGNITVRGNDWWHNYYNKLNDWNF